MNKQLRRAFQFFLKHSGYCVGQRAKGALQLARAERWAETEGYTFEWRYDADADLGDHEYWCNAARRDKAGYDSDGNQITSYRRRPECAGHEAEYCLMLDRNNHVVQSLHGILDATGDYRRVVQAELASEEIPDTSLHVSAYSYMGGA